MELKITVDDRGTREELSKLEPRQFMIAWTTAVKQYAQQKAREKIGGNFGSLIASRSILTDDRDPYRHEIYTGGENGYIAEHIHTGGMIKPKERNYLAIPLSRTMKGLYPREIKGLFALKSRNGNLLLFQKPAKKKKLAPPVYLLKKSVHQKPRPWWPDDTEVASETLRFFNENFV